jgi:hypothetical protein
VCIRWRSKLASVFLIAVSMARSFCRTNSKVKRRQRDREEIPAIGKTKTDQEGEGTMPSIAA